MVRGHSEFDSRRTDLRSGSPARAVLRARLLTARDAWTSDPPCVAPAAARLALSLRQIVEQLEPAVLGLYWPIRSEFNAAALFMADAYRSKSGATLALPCALVAPQRLAYRAWDGETTTARDDHGIPTGTGAEVVPDVVLVPCVGYTSDGYRLGYGGGYFDRWLAAHPGVTAVGVAWSVGRLDRGDFAPEPHDVPMTLVVSDAGID